MPPNNYEGGEGDQLVQGTGKNKYPPKKKVSRAIICNAIKDLEDRHPLRASVGWTQISCCCKFVCCCAKKKKPFRQALKQCMLEEMGLPYEKESVKDPYLILGYGVNAYF